MEHTRISSSEGKHATAQAGRTRSGAQDTADAAGSAQAGGSGGFLALLAALGDATQATDALAPEAATTDLAPEGAVDAAALAAWQGLLQPTVPNAALAAAAGGQGLGDAAVAGVGAGAGGLPTAFSLAPGGALPGLDGTPQGLVAETAMLDGLTGQKDGLGQGTVAGYGRIFSRMQSALAQRGGGTAALDAAAGKAAAADGTLGATASGAASAALQAAAAGAGLATVPAAAAAAGGAGGAAATDRATGAGSALAGIDVPAPALENLAGAGAAGAGGREGGAAGQHSGDPASAAGAWQDAVGALATPEAAGSDGLAAFAEQMPLPAEEQVAEQVAYWVHQKTQNAELTLNRDGQPVEVSVSLTGNEAHVTFRSDQAHTREALDRSMAQLSELLRSEGLVLSGMSVGTPGGGGAGGDAAGQQRQRGDARQAQVTATAPAGAAPAGAARPGGQPDRAVDVFV